MSVRGGSRLSVVLILNTVPALTHGKRQLMVLTVLCFTVDLHRLTKLIENPS